MVGFSKNQLFRGIKQESFHFLGFTFYLGKSRNGRIIPKLKSSGKRIKTKLKKVIDWCKGIRIEYKLPIIWATFCSKLRGHIRYYGLSHNCNAVNGFICKAVKIMFKWLNRRSQKKSFNWEQFRLYYTPSLAKGKSISCHVQRAYLVN